MDSSGLESILCAYLGRRITPILVPPILLISKVREDLLVHTTLYMMLSCSLLVLPSILIETLGDYCHDRTWMGLTFV